MSTSFCDHPNLKAVGTEFIRLSQRTQHDWVNLLILCPTMLQRLIVPFLESVNPLLLHLSLILAQFHKTILENGKKQQKRPVIYVTNQLGLIDA